MTRHADQIYRCPMSTFEEEDRLDIGKGGRIRAVQGSYFDTDTGYLPVGLYEVVDVERTKYEGTWVTLRPLDQQNPRRRNPPMTREERAALVEEITRLVDEKASVNRRRLILPEFLEDADITDEEPLAHYGWTRRALSRSLGLPVLGYGGGRIVLRLPDDTVAKIPYGPYGLLQNRSELQRYVSSGKAARALLLPVFDSVEVVLPPPDPHWKDARRVVALIVPEARPLRTSVSSDEHKQMQLERRWQTLVARGEADALEDLRPENSGIYVDPVTRKSRAVILDYALPYVY